MKHNKKFIKTSLTLFTAAALLAPVASPVFAADQPASAQNPAASATSASTNATSTSATAKSTTSTVTMTITKTGTTTPSEAASFLGNSAQVSLKDGKVDSITLHVDGSKLPMAKGQDMSKVLTSLSLNGVAGKQENVAKDGSSLDYVFPATAYKEGKGTLECTLNVMGKTMNEKADVVLGKVAENTNASSSSATTSTTETNANANENTNASANETKQTVTKKRTKKTVKGVKRTLKRNAYVYKKNGKRYGKKVLKKGHKVTTYGRAIKLHHKAFYRISKNTYVRKANF